MAEFIDPAIVPKVTLPSGEKVPCMGMGTFGSDRVSAEDVSAAVAGAIRSGYRMFDCAACYGNEHQIGEVFKTAFDEGVVERKDLFIMTKVWNDMHRKVEEACTKSIQDLQVLSREKAQHHRRQQHNHRASGRQIHGQRQRAPPPDRPGPAGRLLPRGILLRVGGLPVGGEIHHLPARRRHRAAGPGDKGIADRLLPAAGPAARGFSADSESFGIQTVIDGLHVVPSCIGFPVDKPILLHALSHRPDRAGPVPRSVCIDGLGRKKDPMG